MPRVPAGCAPGMRPMMVSADSHPSGLKLVGRWSVAPLARITTWPSIASRVPSGESAKPPATLGPGGAMPLQTTGPSRLTTLAGVPDWVPLGALVQTNRPRDRPPIREAVGGGDDRPHRAIR